MTSDPHFVQTFSYIKTLSQNLFIQILFQIFMFNFLNISFKFLQLWSSVSKKTIILSLVRVRVSSRAISFCYNTMIDHGQTSATFCLLSKIGRRLAVVGTCHIKWTHLFFSHSRISHSDRPQPDVGNVLSPVTNSPMSGCHRYISW